MIFIPNGFIFLLIYIPQNDHQYSRNIDDLCNICASAYIHILVRTRDNYIHINGNIRLLIIIVGYIFDYHCWLYALNVLIPVWYNNAN